MNSSSTFEIVGDVGVLKLDDGKANALGYETLASIDDAVAQAAETAKAFVIAGREGLFSAGFDLKVIQSGGSAAADLALAGARTALKLYGASIPVVAACTGHAVAMGAILLLSSDVRIGADMDAKIGLHEVSIGMHMPIFGSELARDRLDPRYLTSSVSLAQLYDPATAVKVGYLDEVVSAGDVEKVALERAQELADYLTPSAFAATRKNMRGATIEHISSTLEADLKGFEVRDE